MCVNSWPSQAWFLRGVFYMNRGRDYNVYFFCEPKNSLECCKCSWQVWNVVKSLEGFITITNRNVVNPISYQPCFSVSVRVEKKGQVAEVNLNTDLTFNPYPSHCIHLYKSGWWFGFFLFSIIYRNNHPNRLSYFPEGLKPPTRSILL